jgi:segregation and condensation protein B
VTRHVEVSLIQIIESLLFASDAPLTVQRIKDILVDSAAKDIREALNQLKLNFEKSGSALLIEEVAEGYRIFTRPEFEPYVKQLVKSRSISRLTQKALETLAIIAYKQPITKVEIESIRGVNVDGVVRTLLERNLITIKGREKAPGNPLLYGTTRYFLEYFGLKNLDALPKLKELDELLKEDEKFLESLDQVALEQLKPEVLGIKNMENQQLEMNMERNDAGETE